MLSYSPYKIIKTCLAFGSVMDKRSYTAPNNDYKYGFNSMEKDDELKGNRNSYDFGARIYDPRIGRWLGIDPAFKDFSESSPYVGIGNNPIVFIDPDGKRIIVKDVNQQAAVLKMINSKALGLYAFNSHGELTQVRATGDANRFSKYYADKLVEGINSARTIEIIIDDKMAVPNYGPGKTIVLGTGPDTYDVDVESGGGVTWGGDGTDQLVVISGNDNTTLKDKSGNSIEDKPADILAHEVVGHAVPKAEGNVSGDAVVEENKVRAEVKKKGQTGPSPERGDSRPVCKSCTP